MRKLLGALASIAFVAIFAAPAANAQSTGATIMLLHGIPATPVDVEVNGAVAVPNFQFGQMQDLSSLAGTTLTALKVKLAGTSTVAIDGRPRDDRPAVIELPHDAAGAHITDGAQVFHAG